MPLPPVSPAKPITPGSAKITIPAVGLIVAGLLKLFSALTALTVLSHLNRSWLGNLMGPAASVLPFNNPLFGWSIGLFKAIPALLMIYGGLQMLQLRSYASSIAAGILGIVCCSFLGLPMGIWALIVLTRPEVREAFANPPAAQTLRPGNWKWVGPTAGLLTLLLVLGLLLLALMAGARLLWGWRNSDSGSGANAYAAPQDDLKEHGCLNCHDMDKKKVGPAFKDVAAKYKGNKDAAGAVLAKMKEGKGHPKVAGSDDELKAAINAALAAK
jgi:cytochrome c551/c552